MFKRNVFFNYLGQIYTSLIGILIFPFYLKYMGEEAYGLVGFFVLIQTWMLLFDLGMSPTLARQVALSNTSGNSDHLRKLLRSLETVFLVISIIIVTLMIISCGILADKWLKIITLDVNEVAICIAIMGGVISLRWFTTLYKSGINGYEQQVWINIVNIIIITLRFPGALLVFVFYSQSLTIYFTIQLILSVFELIIFNRKMYRCIPKITNAEIKISFISIDVLKSILPFAAGTAYTAGIWVFLTQLDKLILSKALTLSNFGFFTLVVTLVSGIFMLSTPISNAILPRLTSLLSQSETFKFVNLYCLSTRFVCCVIFPVAITMIFYPYQVIYGWTGNMAAANWAKHILPLYALGNAILAIVGFQYYLQYAHGKLKLHIIYNSLLAVVSIPAVYYFAFKYGAIGTGYVWLILNSITLIFWTYIVHRKYLPGVHLRWLLKDVLLPFSLTLICIMPFFIYFNIEHFSRLNILVFIFFITFIAIVFNLCVCFYYNICEYWKIVKL